MDREEKKSHFSEKTFTVDSQKASAFPPQSIAESLPKGSTVPPPNTSNFKAFSPKRKRIYALIAISVILAGIGILHLTDPRKNTLIPCFFYEWTNIPCFGCGVTRCLYCLSKFDFSAAFRYNAYLTVISPLLLYWTGAELLNTLIGKPILLTFQRRGKLLLFLLIGLMCFGILRWVFPALRFGVL